MQVPSGTTGTVGFYNEGFWGFNVDSAKRYIASMYVRGNYSGNVACYFQSNATGAALSSTNITLNQVASSGWKQTYSPTFMPTTSSPNANTTFYFTFDGKQLAGQSLYFNVLSVFKQTYGNRNNGMREDLAESVQNLNAKWIRLPGGNNMEGNGSPYYWKWNQTIGDLKNRPGRPGTWGDINTDGFGLLEMMQASQDLDLLTVLGVWAWLYLDGEVIPQASLQPYVDSVMNELEFLTVSKKWDFGRCGSLLCQGATSTTYGSQRASLGFSNPFVVDYVEIGNEDYLNGGTNSYYSYRFAALYNAIRAKYPSMNTISTINPSPAGIPGSMIDLHIYHNEATFVALFNTFDQANRSFPVFVAEYAATNTGSNNDGQVGAQTFGMACAEAIFLLGCERNSDVIVGSSYGALIKSYNEEPGTVAVIKHTANEILHSTSYYVQKLFADNMGSATLPVTATGGGFGPVYWSATKNSTSTILKLVNYNGATGSANAINVAVQGSTKSTASLVLLSAPNSTSVNNLSELGGEATQIIASTISENSGEFSVIFTKSYQIAILIV
jgi:alpha-N-arabinofuranosidase